MKKFIIVLLIFVSVIGIPLFGAGKKEEAAKARKIAIVTPYMANATTAFVIKRCKKYAENEGWSVSVSDTAGDFGLLVSRIEDAVAQKVDAIVLGMGDPVQMSKGLKTASQAGIPVFGLDAGVTEGVLCNVTSDNTELGIMSAQALVKAIGEKGNVLMFTHDPHPGVRARAKGAEKTLKSYPGISIIGKRHIDVPGPVENAKKIMEDILVSHPEKGYIVGVWAGWDEPAFGATQAIEKMGKGSEIKVVGIDGTDFAKAEILKGGPFVATVAQDFDGMAKKVVSLIKATFSGEKPAQKWYKIKGTLITAANAGK